MSISIKTKDIIVWNCNFLVFNIMPQPRLDNAYIWIVHLYNQTKFIMFVRVISSAMRGAVCPVLANTYETYRYLLNIAFTVRYLVNNDPLLAIYMRYSNIDSRSTDAIFSKHRLEMHGCDIYKIIRPGCDISPPSRFGNRHWLE